MHATSPPSPSTAASTGFFSPARSLVFGAQYAPLSAPLHTDASTIAAQLLALASGGASSAAAGAGASAASTSAGSGGGGSAGGGGGGGFWTRYLRRGLKPRQWDVDYVAYQLVNACRAPAQVYKLTLHRKQTKNTWARDDPAFAAVQLALLTVCALAYGVAYRYTSPLAFLWLAAHFGGTFLLGGLAAATGGWALANARCRVGAALPHSVEQSVEWLFAWDVHCNAFVPVLLLVYVANFLLLPLVMAGDGLVPCLVGNALYAGAAGHYLYITFQGYVVLPFLQHDKLRPLLAGVIAAAVLGVACTLLHVNVAARAMAFAVT